MSGCLLVPVTTRVQWLVRHGATGKAAASLMSKQSQQFPLETQQGSALSPQSEGTTQLHVPLLTHDTCCITRLVLHVLSAVGACPDGTGI